MTWKTIAAGCFGLIVTGSVLPRQTAMDLDLDLSATGFAEHALAYGLCSLALGRGFAWIRALGLLVLVCALGIGLEWVQTPLLERTFNPMDILANSLGLAAGAAAAWLWNHLERRYRGQSETQ